MLSKKHALAGLQCHKRLWWQINEPGSQEMRENLAATYRMREGTRVGALARDYVPGGRLIRTEPFTLEPSILETRDALGDDATRVLYEAAFSALNTSVRADILERNATGWTLIEVKATASLSEVEHVPDITVQACVLRVCGVPVSRYEIMHLNRACRHPDLSNLYTREDVTELVLESIDDIERKLIDESRVVEELEPPVVMTGGHCSQPRECEFVDRCWPELPKHHVTTLYRIGKKAASFVELGYETIDQLPDDIKLSAIAARQRRSVRQGEMIVERNSLVGALAAVAHPVAHLDFETVQPAIPLWPGCRPYDQVPVQLSCHVVDIDGATRHHEWLFDGVGDPRIAAANAILDACAGARTVTAYYSSFERECIKLVAEACPEHAEPLRAIAESLVDLLPIVREHVYHPEFAGSFSLKKVLPALVPTLTYQGLPIAEGETAQVQLSRMYFDAAMSADERAELRAALLQYCELDTRAMVELESALWKLARTE